mgnify:FL=1|tara:strand:- start:3941 stop:4672 length:732 start_codon:yes stop_codon:yes gene_type:complete
MADLSLFPTINPNIEEIIERQEAIDGANLVVEEAPEELGHNDIFGKKAKGTQNIKLEVTQPIPIPKPTRKGNYSHLAEARKKGTLTRQRKAEAKRILKAEAKAIKDEEKRLRREATQERNRVKARERYRKQKATKDEQGELKEKIRLESQAKKDLQERIDKQSYRRPQNRQVAPSPESTGMSFEKFAGYMMQYEGMKQQFAQQQQARKRVQAPPKIEKEFPDNYPLAHIYAKNKNRKADFSHF